MSPVVPLGTVQRMPRMVVHHGAFFCSTGSISRDGERVKSERNADVAWGEKGKSPGLWGAGGVGGVMGNDWLHLPSELSLS